MGDPRTASSEWQLVVEPCIHSGPKADCLSCWVGRALRAEQQAARLRGVLYDAIVGQSSDPDDYGVELDHGGGIAQLGNGREAT